MTDIRKRLADALREGIDDVLTPDIGPIRQQNLVLHLTRKLLSLPGIEIAQWKELPGFPGYLVSEFGDVRSFKYTAPRYLNWTLRRGYPTLYLTDETGRHRHLGVHRAVMLAFVGPPPEGMEIRHLDGDQLNCRLSNLAYGTSSENAFDTVRHGRNRNATKTHCPKGHPYSGTNLIVRSTPNGGVGRWCRECKNQGIQARYHRKVAAAAAAVQAQEQK